ncbi:MAG: glycosyltransferase family 4 protein [Chthoniobacterales bacterium]
MRVIVATVRTPFIYGGAEVHAEGLVKALRAAGHEAELVWIPFNPSDAERIPDQMLACRLMDLRAIDGMTVDRVIALKFPAYLVEHPQKVVWLLHQHRAAYDLWEHALGGLRVAPRGRMVRDIIQRADRQMGTEARAIFSNSDNVARRLKEFCGIDSEPLYHPPAEAESFFCAETVDDFFFYPSRVSPTKRQDLVLRALALTRQPVRLKFAGGADNAAYGKKMKELARELSVAGRVEWMGFVTDAQKREAYAHARAVVFPPLDEDYGYVTLEAMLASKAVITCEDSGGPLEFVLPEETGLIAPPTAEGLAAAMDALWEKPARAGEYGRAARRHYDEMNLSWSHVVEKLLA